MKGRENEAYRILFNKKYDMELSEKEVPKLIEAKQQQQQQHVNNSSISNNFLSIVKRLRLIEVISDFFQANDLNAKQSRFQGMFKEVNALYGPPRLRRMALICHFTWCVTALSYYVTGKYHS